MQPLIMLLDTFEAFYHRELATGSNAAGNHFNARHHSNQHRRVQQEAIAQGRPSISKILGSRANGILHVLPTNALLAVRRLDDRTRAEYLHDVYTTCISMGLPGIQWLLRDVATAAAHARGGSASSPPTSTARPSPVLESSPVTMGIIAMTEEGYEMQAMADNEDKNPLHATQFEDTEGALGFGDSEDVGQGILLNVHKDLRNSPSLTHKQARGWKLHHRPVIDYSKAEEFLQFHDPGRSVEDVWDEGLSEVDARKKREKEYR